MSKIKTAFRLLATNRKNFVACLMRYVPSLFPDEFYIRWMYYFKMGKKLNLMHPTLFTEKIQWLKLHDKNPLYTELVDKYAVKEYVSKKIGIQYVIKTLGVWDEVENIDWEKLPSQFVLKTTHGGGGNGVVIVKDKASANRKEVYKKLRKAMKQKIYEYNREWPYKNVKKRIIAEEYMQPEEGVTCDLADYKFFCFNGTPLFCQVIRDRHVKETIDFYDMEWKHQEFVGLNPDARNGLTQVARPLHFENMKELCLKLAEGIPFVRVDLYVIYDKEYFGELTFFPAGGFGEFHPSVWDTKLGELIRIPETENN